MKRDSVAGTFTVAAVLCIVCSVLVSAAAIGLRDRQETMKSLDVKKNILVAAGLADDDTSNEEVARIYEERVTRKLIDLSTGEPIRESESHQIDPDTYDPRSAARDPSVSQEITTPGALPGINRREKYAFAYEIEKDGELEQIVLPVYGKGLWSTLYGFLAIESDTTTVSGITFYEHAETPGLGGEIQNPRWTTIWKGKQLFNEHYEVEIRVLKGPVDRDAEEAIYQVDGLSGATITTRGVSDLIRYWIGPDGFGTYLERVRERTGAGAE